MSGSMYAAISGLNADQALLGTVSENIANVNTVGYKASSMTFAQALQQTLSGASAPTASIGGINPVQEAAGGAVNVAGVQINTNEGSLQSTGINTNLAIQGNGYFVVKTSQGGYAYTRAGDFSLDANGNLVNPEGDQVMGWSPTTVQNKAQTGTNMVPIAIKPNQTQPATATKNVTVTGNINSQDSTVSVPITAYDSLGNQIPITLTFTQSTTNPGTWNVAYSYTAAGANTPTTGSAGTVAFSSSGAVSSGGTGTTITVNGQAINLNYSGMNDFAMSSNLSASADGNPAGTLENFTIGSDGTITGSFSNGGTQVLGQVALADFTNPGGLLNIGNTVWQQSPNSGTPIVGTASTGQLGSIAAGELEGSNVSLANEFVNMIIAQQGYQANSKVITISQTLDTTLVNAIQ
ncbi:flagellar hook protein FlgE [Sulfobacillus harzensis]|uniref:Flagellar hook protein FlgE n=1 Tax=Sulfobacillus harzensis TaxID=2729629 RepID=A0A7Y0L5D5_9FIRM|nr:flagellar hook protein FlgE [Sulfobacillus harzensis]NMP23556.1 flagellar hook protein FlgE [Sulfobacillus harzensis]